jgi:hypothetical protein
MSKDEKMMDTETTKKGLDTLMYNPAETTEEYHAEVTEGTKPVEPEEDYQRPSDMSVEKYNQMLSEFRAYGLDRIYVVFDKTGGIVTTTFNTSKAGDLEDKYDGHVELYNLD